MIQYVIGIDPGKNTGLAVWDRASEELLRVGCYDFWIVYRLVTERYHPANAELIIEVPDNKSIWHSTPDNLKAAQRQAVNVGGVLREAELLALGFESLGFKVKRVNPRGKVPADRFKKYTRWPHRTNEHSRDAAMLCFRR